MKTRPLGDTGVAVAELGVGAWALGKQMDGRQALHRLCAALEQGRNFIDTSPAYAEGESERIVGVAVRELRARDFAIIATRVAHRDAPAPAVVQSAENSLRAQRAEALPLLLLTVSASRSASDPSWAELRSAVERLIRAGKILHWGIALEEAGASAAVRNSVAGEATGLVPGSFPPSVRGIALLAEPGVEVVRVGVTDLGAVRAQKIGIVAIGDPEPALADPSVSVVVKEAW
jgi:aryl-alcohol dehydrogenase-like predicted oxidoreductase